ncbi:catalase, partial [Chromobacterium piscinae]
DLKARDTDVRRHEAAHQAAGGSLAGAASFTYEQGPDGKQYAIGGEVPIQMSQGGTPQQTIQNAETVRAAALAPADPSGQDRAVA